MYVFFLILFIDLFLAVLGLHRSTGYFLVAACRILTAAASSVAEHRLSGTWAQCCGYRALECGLSGCGSWAQLLCIMWDPLGLEIEPMCPALAGGFSITEPPVKPCWYIFNRKNRQMFHSCPLSACKIIVQFSSILPN